MLLGIWSEPKQKSLDGQSLKPLLENPQREWKCPVVIILWVEQQCRSNEGWHYILYRDAGEELYGHDRNPNEWTNLAPFPKYSSVKTSWPSSYPSKT
jgi:hypothetical protein